MNKTFLRVIALLLAFSLALSACTLPFPGGAPETPEATTESQAEEPRFEPTATKLPTSAGGSAGEQPTATPLTPAATATSRPVEPTATPLPQITAPQAVRIQFKPGATEGTVEGELSAGQTLFYVLGAEEGQTMNVEAWSPNDDVYLGISGASTGKVLALASDKLTEWSGILPGSQDYYLSVTAGGGRTSYSITVEVLPTSGATAIPASRFDPYVSYGEPDYLDPMAGGNFTEWASPESGTLPDNSYIQLAFKDYKLYVTGKQLGFSTWWFTWHSLEDFYLETTFDTEDCSGKDAYGMIIRGPEHKAGVSYGYVVAFSCDGSYWIFRLDGADPWDAEDLVAWSKSDYINSGSDKQNVMGIQAEGNIITVYANGYQIAQVTDDEFGQGRFGVFVSPAVTQPYTYRVTKIAYWVLGEE
ncbi:MAG: hypothetical protein JW726_08355 [Anaerolineales bacterium]|nr:hypothetical protein [Anaerolineales bacterium]